MTFAAVISGAIIMGYVIAALFFFKFWRRTGDRLFLAFSAAFLLMGATPFLTALLEVPREEQSPFYILRLIAFLIIIAAVAGKSRSAGGR